MAPSSESAEALAYLIHHVVLPPQLPQKRDYNSAHEQFLLETTIQALEDLKGSVDVAHASTVASAIATIENLRNSRDTHGYVGEAQLRTMLGLLADGKLDGVVPLEITAQNAGILIVPCDDSIRFEFFELSPTNRAAMASKGRLVREFPALASKIDTKVARNVDLTKSLARTVSKLSAQAAPDMQPQIRKNGEDMKEERDTTNPAMVTDYFMNLTAALGQITDAQRITKNTREEVLWNDCLNPWRRSPLWLLVRVSLQTLFTRRGSSMQPADGLYKAFTIQLLSCLLNMTSKHWKTIGSESLYLISAKLCRRIRKLEHLGQPECLLPKWAAQIGNSVTSAHLLIGKQWEGLDSATHMKFDSAWLPSIHPETDISMTLPELDAFLVKVAARQRNATSSNFRPASEYHNFPDDVLPSIVFGSGEDKYFRLSAFETWIEKHLQSWLASHLRSSETCGQLRRLMERYHAHASDVYADIPINLSIMYLVLLEMWVACDNSACALYPLIRRYDHEIPLDEAQCLVLPFKSQMDRLLKVEQYATSRRNMATKDAPSIYRNFGKSTSFAVKFFDGSRELQAELSRIERDATEKQKQKRQELGDLKQKYHDLMEQYNHPDTKCEFHEVVYDKYYGYTRSVHAKNGCAKCALQKNANGLVIGIYEWPVSSDPSIAKATVFELKIPQAFSEWRDASVHLISRVLGFPHLGEPPKYSGTLDSHHGLSHMLSTSYHLQCIVPLSEVKSHTKTHRNKLKGIQHLVDANVCLNNALQYQYYNTVQRRFSKVGISTGEIPKKCLHGMPVRSSALTRFLYRPPSAPDGLAPNEVLANLADCPPHFSIDEFKAFGALPLGHKILYSSLLTQLAMPVVDFSKAEVQSLVLQVIHQVGPSLGSLIERANHHVLTEESFGHAMLVQLEISLGRVEKNWESWRALASFIQLSRRVLILTTSPQIRNRCLRYLDTARSVCYDWLLCIKKRISVSTDNEQRTELCSRATEIGLIGTSTFDVDCASLQAVFQQPSAISMFIQSSIVVQENMASVHSDYQGLQNILLQSWRSMMYRILPQLRKHLLQDSSGLNEAVIANWADFKPSPKAQWTALSIPQDHWLCMTCGALPVHFNVLTTELLVNGVPLSRLPKQFMDHVMYEPLFQKSALDVVPTDKPGMDFSGKSTYQGYTLHFGMAEKDMLVLATIGKTRIDLLPMRLFTKQLPSAFSADFIHWYDRISGEVIFRERQNPWTASGTEWRLRKHGSKWRLVKNTEYLVDMSSNTARSIARLFGPLEAQNRIHIVLNTASQTVTIELPRLQLDFYVEHQDDRVLSRQFRGMMIDHDQDIGTLVGLTNRMVLRHARQGQEQRLVIVPAPNSYGAPSVTHAKVCTIDHVSVTIAKDGPSKVYAYSLDRILGCLTDSGDLRSKLFLCYLHGLTSHCLPDQLTGRTGTESALRILQSAAVRSFEHLTTANVELLEQIAAIAPQRSFYPPERMEMQSIKWNKQLPTLSQHAGLRTHVQDIIRQAQKMILFDPSIEAIIKTSAWKTSDAHLDMRDAIRNSTFRTCGAGAEVFATQHDANYDSRDTCLDSARGRRAYSASKLILRDRAALSLPVTNLKRVLQAQFGKDTVQGCQGTYNASSLRFDSTWLGESADILTESWCNLHKALSAPTGVCNNFDIAAWLSTMAFAQSANMAVIEALAAIHRLAEFATVQPPLVSEFALVDGEHFSRSKIYNTAESAAKKFENSTEARSPKKKSETDDQHSRRLRDLFQNRVEQAIQTFISGLEKQWPIDKPSTPTSQNMNTYLNVSTAMTKVFEQFARWHSNRLFSMYLTTMESMVARQPVTSIPLPRHILKGPAKKRSMLNTPRYLSETGIFDMKSDITGWPLLVTPCEPEIPTQSRQSPDNNFGMKHRLEQLCKVLQGCAKSGCEKKYIENLRASCVSLDSYADTTQILSSLSTDEARKLIGKYLEACEKHLKSLHDALGQAVKSHCPFSDRIALYLQHCSRISPTFWLSQLHKDRFGGLSESWKSAILEYGLAITQLHRAQRLAALINKPVELIEELRHVGHTNWNPREFPETLLLEAESGIMVRAEQEFIASEMRTPKDNENVVMQLLMGGGKSSTIVPILAAHLTDRQRLVRVIVAKPQSKQMLQMLVAKLGGLLNRRIYHMPFSRNLRLDSTNADTLRSIYEECIATRGVLLLMPEHILSFKEFFETVARDIVDESDMNYSVKFELIYTMGSQQSIELAPDRWQIIQDVLGFLPRIAIQVKKLYPQFIEIEHAKDGKFPRIRLLRVDAANELLTLLAKRIVDHGVTGLPIRNQAEACRAAIYRYITEADLTIEQVDAVEKGRFWTESTKQSLLLVRGLIACGVLRFALSTKRWRVSFGLDTLRKPKTSLAVPYRSKDSPSPRSEFSHPDCVIILTLLSYYYGGLDDDQLFDAFHHLRKSDQAAIHYSEWVGTAATSMSTAFRHVSGVSIRDRHQCIMEVFPALRYSKKAIDYYLSFLVFPKEMKQFPQKLSGSGWDIGAKKIHPVTGFSGTNDTHHLLPLDVHHLDLRSQTHTNALVLGYLLQDETSVQLIPERTTGTDAEHLIAFINKLDSEVRVVLDCGAAILDQGNEQVATTWLKSCKSQEVQAAVFFDDEELSVLDRTGRVESFQTSSFAKQLDVCLVYLDEAHTRGTDLKLPRNYRAAVSLGAQLTKDTLTQACMRMRQLGKGQSITFVIPEEISTKIRERTGKSPDAVLEVSDVLCWSIGETWDDLKRSMPLWAVQGHRYETHKHLLHGSNTTLEQVKTFLEDEAQSIEDRYRPRAQDDNDMGQLKHWDMSNENIGRIVSRCRDFEAMGFGSATLSEEQERELAPEIEEERQIELPPRMKADVHQLHPDLERLVRTGYCSPVTSAFSPAFPSLRLTSAAKLFSLSNFPAELLVTQDYVRTVKVPIGDRSFVSDPYQRPVQWILSVRGDEGLVSRQIIISPYEANALLDIVKENEKTTLHLFAPRANASFASLDKLELYNVGRKYNPDLVPRSLTVQLNLFAGSLYLRSFTEYTELCDFLGLLQGKAELGQQVFADGFIDPPVGMWGLKKSPVPFLRTLLMKIRREGEGVEKTHLGKILNGERLEELDFELGA